MKGYLSIGKVAKLKNISIKSLRYYDEIGVLKPAYINPETNYRYYKEDQLFIIDAITLCIEVGIPLKDFPKYQGTDNAIDLRKLLGDGKMLAEEKIRSMSTRLQELQHTLEELEKATPSSLSVKTQQVLPEKHVERRIILATPFDVATDVEHYKHKLLSLFVSAQRLGLNASYPSGLLYRYTKDNVSKFVFIHLSEDTDPLTNMENVIEELTILTLPEGNYFYEKNPKHQIETPSKLCKEAIAHKVNYLVLETDLLKEDSSTGNRFELQVLL